MPQAYNNETPSHTSSARPANTRRIREGRTLSSALILALALLAVPSCSRSSHARHAADRIDPSNLGSNATNLEKLFDNSPMELAARRGGLRFESTVTLSRHSPGADHAQSRARQNGSTAPQDGKEAEQDLGPADPTSPVDITERSLLEVDGKGRIHGRAYNNREYGYEFVWADPTLYFHLRYRPYMKWKAEREESLRHVRRIWGAPKDVWHLLAPCMTLRKDPGEQRTGKAPDETRYKLQFVAAQPAGPASRWQTESRCLRLDGDMVVSQEPLVTRLHIKASISLAPAGKQGKARILDITYDHRVTLGPKDLNIPLPKNAIIAPLRDRPELDRLKLLGRRPKPGWYRGGGPVRWWRRHNGRRAGRPARRRPRRH